jgi:hypothetical protein
MLPSQHLVQHNGDGQQCNSALSTISSSATVPLAFWPASWEHTAGAWTPLWLPPC